MLTCYIGLAKPSGIASLLETIDKNVGLSEHVEVSMEVSVGRILFVLFVYSYHPLGQSYSKYVTLICPNRKKKRLTFIKSIELSKLQGFKKAGVNRLSLGIQSFNNQDLKVLGRDHSGDEALKALSIAKEIFHKERVTFDLIYARPGQTVQGNMSKFV